MAITGQAIFQAASVAAGVIYIGLGTLSFVLDDYRLYDYMLIVLTLGAGIYTAAAGALLHKSDVQFTATTGMLSSLFCGTFLGLYRVVAYNRVPVDPGRQAEPVLCIVPLVIACISGALCLGKSLGIDKVKTTARLNTFVAFAYLSVFVSLGMAFPSFGAWNISSEEVHPEYYLTGILGFASAGVVLAMFYERYRSSAASGWVLVGMIALTSVVALVGIAVFATTGSNAFGKIAPDGLYEFGTRICLIIALVIPLILKVFFRPKNTAVTSPSLNTAATDVCPPNSVGKRFEELSDPVPSEKGEPV